MHPVVIFFFFFLIIRPPPKSTLFPYTPLFRFGGVQTESSVRSSPGGRRPPRFEPRCGRKSVSAKIVRSEEHTSELQSPCNLVCRLLLEKKKRHTLCARRTTPRHSTCPRPVRYN